MRTFIYVCSIIVYMSIDGERFMCMFNVHCSLFGVTAILDDFGLSNWWLHLLASSLWLIEASDKSSEQAAYSVIFTMVS